MTTTTARRRATQPESPTSSTRNDAFVQQVLHEVFRPRDLSLAREPGFIDRQPDEQSRRLGEVVDQVVEETGRKTLSYWLDKAAQAETEEQRCDALAMAERTARKMRVPLADFIFGRAA